MFSMDRPKTGAIGHKLDEKFGRNRRKTLFCSLIYCNSCPDYPSCHIKREVIYYNCLSVCFLFVAKFAQQSTMIISDIICSFFALLPDLGLILMQGQPFCKRPHFFLFSSLCTVKCFELKA